MPHERDGAMNTKKFHVALPVVVTGRAAYAARQLALFLSGFPDLTDRDALQAAFVAIPEVDQPTHAHDGREHGGQDAYAMHDGKAAYGTRSECQQGDPYNQAGQVGRSEEHTSELQSLMR